MSDLPDVPKPDPTAETLRAQPMPGVDEDHFEDEERVLAGRLDVNYPAMLTKDVQGG